MYPARAVAQTVRARQAQKAEGAITCGATKPLASFLRIKQSRDAYYGSCKRCRAKRAREQYQHDPEERERQKQRVRRNRARRKQAAQPSHGDLKASRPGST
jgi:hypothetical protein